MSLPPLDLMLSRNSACAAGEPRAGVEHDLYVQLADSTGSLITAASDGFSANSVQVCTACSTLHAHHGQHARSKRRCLFSPGLGSAAPA